MLEGQRSDGNSPVVVGVGSGGGISGWLMGGGEAAGWHNYN
jgi:hypothetical protein